MPHVFISYAKKDTRPLATTLRDALRSVGGLTAWMDESLEVGQSWALQIQAEIDRADCVVVLLSPDVNRPETPQHRHSFVLNEITYAQEENKPILPVMVTQTRTPIQIAGLQHIDLTSNPTDPTEIVKKICIRFNLDININKKSQNIVSQTQKPPSQSNVQQKTLLSIGRIKNISDAIDYALNFNGTKNNQWTQVFTQFIGLKRNAKIADMLFCLVPVGNFMMGSDFQEDERPIHHQIFDKPFWISQYPITNAQWMVAINNKVVDYPSNPHAAKWLKSSKMSNAPVVGVNWIQARKFAEWLGCRLPTEREWEYAARGVESLIYPWGNILNEEYLAYKSNNWPENVTSIPQNRSWVGAAQLSGNVWEWTESLKENYPYIPDGSRERYFANSERVIRGGSWMRPSIESRASARGVANVHLDHPDYGFRVVLPIL